MHRLPRGALAIAATVAGACTHDLIAPAGAPVSASVTVSPQPGATGVSRGAAVTVAFNYAMDSASCAGRFALLVGDSSGPAVPGRMTWDSTYHHMTFTPDSMMSPGTGYDVELRDGMMTRDSLMPNSGMGMRGMGAMSGIQHLMPGGPMLFDQPPPGATRTAYGMRWSFATGT